MLKDKNNFALVRKPSSAVEKAAPGAKRILSGMVADALALGKKAVPPRIIVVDDEPMFLELYGHMIRNYFKNVTALTFDDGDRAWQEILRTVPDLLITDMNRSGLNGARMLRLLARNKVKFPIFVVSGTATEEDVLECAGSGLNISFLSKPFDVEIFAKLLKTVLKLSRDAHSTKAVSSN